MLQQASHRSRYNEILGFDLEFSARITSFSITVCFEKVNFQGFNLVILSFELSCAFLYALCELSKK